MTAINTIAAILASVASERGQVLVLSEMSDYQVVSRRGVWQWCRKVGSAQQWSEGMYGTEERANEALDAYLAGLADEE